MIRLHTLGTLTLHGVDGAELRTVLTQPKRLALLAYLAVESARGFLRRDHLFGVFWPELAPAHARQALRQSLYFLRCAIGEQVVVNRGAEEVAIAPDALWCDARAFVEELDRNRLEDALALHHGDFLTGFFIPHASVEFEEWLSATRERLRRRALHAAWALAEARERAGSESDAAAWARFAAWVAPDDEPSVQRLVRMLDRQGDRAGALRVYAAFAERLAKELDAEPSAETRALIAAVRSRVVSSALPAASTSSTSVNEPRDAPPGPAPAVAPAAPAAPRAPGRARRWRRGVSIAAAAIVTAVTAGLLAERSLGANRPRWAAGIERHAATQPMSAVTTPTLAARRVYEQGLVSFYQHDVTTAVQLFHAALREDSTFALAAYYAALAEQESDGAAARRDFALALRLAVHAPARERLMIRQTWAFVTNDPAQLALAESLVVRYPGAPDGELALGRSLLWGGHFLEALPHLLRTVKLDTQGLTERSPQCQACEALGLMASAYIDADSLSAAERVARLWTHLQPNAPPAWWLMESVYDREERYDSARAAERNAERLSPSGATNTLPRAISAIRAGDFAEADRLLVEQSRNGNAAERGDALWWLVISLRNQGRLREALGIAERLVRNGASEPASFSTPQSLNAVAVAQVQFEMGRFRRAAMLFDSLANVAWRFSPAFPGDASGLLARHRIWMTTHVATALAAGGDTASLAPLADSLAAWEGKSALFRDQVLDHYVRGLLLAARGRRAQAAEQFRIALVSPIDGYSRVNLELGKMLIAQGRPREAIPVLQAPLHGWLEASNYYVTYTDLHALLGDAFDRAGEPDSALAHYRRVLAAWRNADPSFRPRAAWIRRRVQALIRAPFVSKREA